MYPTYIETYQKFEDKYNCSGMCRPGLFYYGNPLTYGPPTKTCLRKMMDHVKRNALPLANTCFVTGSLCILLSLLSLAMNHRPIDEDISPKNRFFKMFTKSTGNDNSG